MDALTAQLKEQAAQIQKVSAQLEVSKPAAQVVESQTIGPRRQTRHVSFGERTRFACAPLTLNQKIISKSLMPFHFPGWFGSKEVLSTHVP